MMDIQIRTAVLHGKSHEHGVEPEVDEELLHSRWRVANRGKSTHCCRDNRNKESQVSGVVGRLENARTGSGVLHATTLETELHEEFKHAREEVVENVAILNVRCDVCV